MEAWILLALGALLLCAALRLLRYPKREQGFRRLSRGEVAFLDAVSDAMFPPGGAVPPSGRDAGIPAYLDRFVDALPSRPRLLIHLLLMLVEHATLVFPAGGASGWRRFSSLSAEQRVAALQGWRRSRLLPRRLVFSSLRAIVTMGYFADPAVLRELNLAPREVPTPVCESDLIYPPAGKGPESIAYAREDLTPPSSGVPLDDATPLHPAYREATPT